MRKAIAPAALLFSSASLSALTIEFDYSLDTNGFFAQQERRDALRAAADFYEGVITDSLSEIKPSGQNTWQLEFNHPGTDLDTTVSNPTIPADTILIYAGGFEIPGAPVGIGGPGGWGASAVDASWFDVIDQRGTPDGGTTTGTDFTPWGGTVSFDTSATWNFSLTTSSSDATDFISVALHELGHVLGIGTAGAWDNLINFDTAAFDGPQAVARYGGGVPVEFDLGHFRDDIHCSNASPGGYSPDNWRNVLSTTLAMFGTPAGLPQIVVMDPSSCPVGEYIKVVTAVDLAALDDIGWEIAYPPDAPAPVPVLAATRNTATGHFTVSFQSSPAHTYQIQESGLLGTWENVGPLFTGDGTEKSFTDTTPPVNRNHYRLLVDPPQPSPLVSPPRLVASPTPKKQGLLPLLKRSRPARLCRDCRGCAAK